MYKAIDSIIGYLNNNEITDDLFRSALADNAVWILEDNDDTMNIKIVFNEIDETETINAITFAPFPLGLHTLKSFKVFNQGMIEDFCDPGSSYYWVENKTRFKGTTFRFAPIGLNNYIEFSVQSKFSYDGKYINGITHMAIQNVKYMPTGYVEFLVATDSSVNHITSLELYYDCQPNSLKNDAYVNIKLINSSGSIVYNSSVDQHPLTKDDPPITVGGGKIFTCRVDVKTINNTTPILRGLFFTYN